MRPPRLPDHILWSVIHAVWIFGAFFSRNSSALFPLGPRSIPVRKRGSAVIILVLKMGPWGPYKLDLLTLSDCCFSEGKELAMMSNAERAFQRFTDHASELEGRLRLSRVGEGSAIRSSLLKIHSWLNFVRSGEVGIASLALSLVVQMGLPAEFPTYTTNGSGSCFTSLPSNKTWSFALSLGCLWYSQIYFFCNLKCETGWEGKSPITLGWLWLLLLFLSVGVMKGLLEKRKTTTVWLLGIVFMFVKQIAVFTQIGLYPGWKEGSQRHVKIFLSCLFACLVCIVIVLFQPVVLYGKT